MKIISFGVNLDLNYEIKKTFDNETFINEIYYKQYDIIIIYFEYLNYLLDIKTDAKIIFIYDYIDELIYKKALEYGDFIYTFDEIWKLNYRIKQIQKSLNIKDIFKYKNLTFNLKTKNLYNNKELINLSNGMIDLLTLLIRNKNRFISKEFIIDNTDYIDNINSIKVLISKLRKIGFEIENKKNLGYKIKEQK